MKAKLTNVPSKRTSVEWCIHWNEIHPIIQARGLSRFHFTPNRNDHCHPMMHFSLDGSGGFQDDNALINKGIGASYSDNNSVVQ